MSGHKRATVSIAQEELDRLREIEAQHSAQICRPETAVQIHDESLQNLRTGMAWMSYRHDELVASLNTVDDQLGSLEAMTAGALQRYQVQVEQALDAQSWSQQANLDQALSLLYTQFNDMVAAEHEQNQRDLTRLQRVQARQSGDLQRKVDLAQLWLTAADTVCVAIESDFDHSALLPGQVDDLRHHLDFCYNNFEQGMPEAVVAGAQQVYSRAASLHLELERLQTEWLTLYYAACEAYRRLDAAAIEQQSIEAIDLEGEGVGIWIDVDYWSDGRLLSLLRTIEQRLTQLEDATHLPDRDSLRYVLSEEIPSLEEELVEIVFTARVSVINSQMRINLADLVVQALSEQGFVVDDATYQDADMRQSFFAQLKNNEGGAVSVRVSPDGRQIGDYSLQIDSQDAQHHTHHEMVQRWREIRRSLANKGVTITAPEREPVQPRRPGRSTQHPLPQRTWRQPLPLPAD